MVGKPACPQPKSRSIYAANQASLRGNPGRQKTPVVTLKAKARLTQVIAKIHLLAAVGKKRHRLSRRCL